MQESLLYHESEGNRKETFFFGPEVVLYPRAPSSGCHVSPLLGVLRLSSILLEGEACYGEVKAREPVPGGGLAVTFYLANAKALSGLFSLAFAGMAF